MHFSARKFFLVSFVVLLLVGIPVSVYFLQQQQTIQQQAEKSTNFSFTPASSSSNPIKKEIGDSIPLDVMVDPGTNIVSSVTIEIQYDADKLEAPDGSFVPDTTVFPTILSAPVYTSGKIVVILGVDSPNKAISVKSKAGTVTFKAKASTPSGTPTVITYTSNNIATSRGSNDQALENVFSSGQPAYIQIGGAEAPTGTPTTVPTGGPTAVPTAIPTAGPTAEPTAVPTAAPTSAPSNAAPSCTALTSDLTSGDVPLTVNFTANGTDTDGTLAKVTFNFGDGQVSDVTSGGGIGSASANVQLAHTYTSAGTFQATSLLTDNGNGVSTTGNCTLTIIANGAAAPATPTPTIAPSGSAEILFGVGIVSLLLIIGGSLIFFIL